MGAPRPRRIRAFGGPLNFAAVLSACLVTVLTAPSPAAGRVSHYLALGDSVPVWNGSSSYPNLILAHYRRELAGVQLDNMAVSGETTTSMLHGGQYAAALAFLRAHKGHIALITIDIGGNDIVGCALTPAGADPASPCATQARATIKRNLTAMLRGLHAGAARVRVIGMSYYDPLLGDWLAGGLLHSLAKLSEQGLVILNQELTSIYGGATQTANVQDTFRSRDLDTLVPSPWGRVPIAVDRACSSLDIVCRAGAPEGFGDDPNPAGARAIAGAFERTIDPLCLRRRSRTWRC